jgi:tetratricopeptide (TPR) repeat protein
MAWTKFPHADDAYVHTAASLKKAWGRLHVGDAEPFPRQAALVEKIAAQGIAPRVRASLEKTIKLAPGHADAHIALGAFHAAIIGSVGAMIGGLTYGVKKEEAYKSFKKALELNPDSAVGRIEYANALAVLDGKKKMDEAVKLYEAAAAVDPQDAMERLDVEAAKEELEDE